MPSVESATSHISARTHAHREHGQVLRGPRAQGARSSRRTAAAMEAAPSMISGNLRVWGFLRWKHRFFTLDSTELRLCATSPLRQRLAT